MLKSVIVSSRPKLLLFAPGTLAPLPSSLDSETSKSVSSMLLFFCHLTGGPLAVWAVRGLQGPALLRPVHGLNVFISHRHQHSRI